MVRVEDEGIVGLDRPEQASLRFEKKTQFQLDRFGLLISAGLHPLALKARALCKML